MFWHLTKYLKIDMLDSIEDFEYMNDTTSDKLLFAYYKANKYTIETATRDGGEKSAMPFITRGTLCSWLAMQVLDNEVWK